MSRWGSKRVLFKNYRLRYDGTGDVVQVNKSSSHHFRRPINQFPAFEAIPGSQRLSDWCQGCEVPRGGSSAGHVLCPSSPGAIPTTGKGRSQSIYQHHVQHFEAIGDLNLRKDVFIKPATVHCLQFELTGEDIQRIREGFIKWVQKYEK